METIVCSKLVRKLYLVYFLNVLDWICTVLLLKTEMFYEANPIARAFIGSISLGFLFKALLPFIIVYLISRFMSILSLKELRLVDKMIAFTLTVYIAVMLDHIINFVIFIIH